MFSKILIANRGEIACRIIRTARRMGIATVAVYSDADANAQHVQQADIAIRIGPAAASESYLNIDAILAAARRTGAQAIHPGYGFLSENPEFADACAQSDLIFIGPSSASMRAMGSKSAAKTLMETYGVPVLPGYHGNDQHPNTLAQHAALIGYPVVIKAVSGGGGRGMRVVHASNDLVAALASAQQEGASAFGDPRVLVERYLQRPRHIEVQVFGDMHGNVVHLFERDCSTQRRHQKIIEEAPAPDLTEATRAAMGAAAVAAARAVNYVGAGTVEFVMDDTGFYFLEMNTRLQVEHPVTEAITGFDLVEWQLRIAAGGPLPVAQSAIAVNGHAVEVRIYAEDPARDFAPSIGRLTRFHLPTTDARVDGGFIAGDTISIHYDAMLAKLIVHAPTRAEALGKLRQALAESEIIGVAHNLDLLGRIAAHPDFISGGIDTGFIERQAVTLLPGQPTPTAAILALATLGVVAHEQARAEDIAAASADPYSPWHATDQWWTNTSLARDLLLVSDDSVHSVQLHQKNHRWLIAVGETALAAENLTFCEGQLSVHLDGVRHTARAHLIEGVITLRHAGQSWCFTVPDPIVQAAEADEGGGKLIAPLPGQVTQVLASIGQIVARGDVLIVLEAMKTVFRLTATGPGTVETIACGAGDMVQEGQILVRFVSDELASARSNTAE